jgi:hypothetical protein
MATRKLSAAKQLGQIVGFDLVSERPGQFGGTVYGTGSRSSGRKWLLFTDYAAASRAAVKQVEEWLRDDPSVFSTDFIRKYVTIPVDVVDALVGELEERYERKAKWLARRQEAREYAVEEPLGFLEDNELDYVDFIDVKRAAKAAVAQDGAAHFLSVIDGDTIEPKNTTSSKWVAFRTD